MSKEKAPLWAQALVVVGTAILVYFAYKQYARWELKQRAIAEAKAIEDKHRPFKELAAEMESFVVEKAPPGDVALAKGRKCAVLMRSAAGTEGYVAMMQSKDLAVADIGVLILGKRTADAESHFRYDGGMKGIGALYTFSALLYPEKLKIADFRIYSPPPRFVDLGIINVMGTTTSDLPIDSLKTVMEDLSASGKAPLEFTIDRLADIHLDEVDGGLELDASGDGGPPSDAVFALGREGADAGKDSSTP